jgi:hypothetical protein
MLLDKMLTPLGQSDPARPLTEGLDVSRRLPPHLPGYIRLADAKASPRPGLSPFGSGAEDGQTLQPRPVTRFHNYLL